MLAVSDAPNLSSLEYVEKVNQKARSYSEVEKAALKRILFNIVERVITKRELENSEC